MPYHVPPSLPRRSRLVPWLGMLWIASTISTTIGLVIFTMFAARDGMSSMMLCLRDTSCGLP